MEQWHYAVGFVVVLVLVFVGVWWLAGGTLVSSDDCAPAGACDRASLPCGVSGSSTWPLSGDCLGRPKCATVAC